jgi:predicted membrane channel-forming protein YqfA (hemolysin III family)
VISASVAFLPGGFVYYKWKPPEAKWLWIAGVCGFAWRVILGSPQTIHEEVGWFTLGLVSLRVVSYSLGAFCYESFAAAPSSSNGRAAGGAAESDTTHGRPLTSISPY